MKKLHPITLILIVFLHANCSEGIDDPRPIERNGSEEVLDTPNASDYHPRFSPDGNYIAYTIYDGNVNEIWMFDLTTNSASPLIQGRSGDLYMSWSPDGSKLVFDCYNNVNVNQVHIFDLATGNIVQITNTTRPTFQADWCRKTNKLVMEHEGYLSEMNSDGSERVKLVSEQIYSSCCAVSPDGSMIAYDSERTGSGDIYIIKRDGTDIRKITNHSGVNIRPRWHPDGTKILYESDRSGNQDIWVYDLTSQTHTQITFTPGYDCMGDWHPDGNKIVFCEETNPELRYGSKLAIIPFQQ